MDFLFQYSTESYNYLSNLFLFKEKLLDQMTKGIFWLSTQCHDHEFVTIDVKYGIYYVDEYIC
jgi:hypothetical protein